jgi:hypothetical protein
MGNKKQEWYVYTSYNTTPPMIRVSSIEVIDVEKGEGQVPYYYVVIKTIGGNALRVGEYNTKERATEKATELFKELFK